MIRRAFDSFAWKSYTNVLQYSKYIVDRRAQNKWLKFVSHLLEIIQIVTDFPIENIWYLLLSHVLKQVRKWPVTDCCYSELWGSFYGNDKITNFILSP